VNKRISLAEIKKIELDLLKNVVKVCKENNLRYFLAGGTLLGAIRHQGFIPWDDDIDVLMPRKDYMQLINIFKRENKKNMKMFSANTNNDYYYTFLKVVDTRTKMFINERLPLKDFGVCIDIFPMDGLPENQLETILLLKIIRHYNKIRATASMLRFPNYGWYKIVPKRFYYLFSKHVGYKKPIQKIEELATKYDFETCDYIGCLVWGYGIKEKISKKSFESTVEVQFEDGYYDAPIGYDEYLTNLYGDYLQLPSEEKRVSHHNYEAYWK
jgi:lipopolysaccharide cholinephosphotransferase